MIPLVLSAAGAAWPVLRSLIVTPLGAAAISGLVAYHAGHWLGARDASKVVVARYERAIAKAKEEADERVQAALEAASKIEPVPAGDDGRRRLCDADAACRARRKP